MSFVMVTKMFLQEMFLDMINFAKLFVLKELMITAEMFVKNVKMEFAITVGSQFLWNKSLCCIYLFFQKTHGTVVKLQVNCWVFVSLPHSPHPLFECLNRTMC